jgi:eukaryotic-like serine/threonine-protein kinase
MIGETVSHYQIVSALGGGGMSAVYKARDIRLGRFVALKFLLEEFCRDRASLEQFYQEARIVSSLNHPGICTIHDIGRHMNRPFIVMEYLEGETLRDKLRRNGLTMQQAVAIGIDIADVASQAHASGIVHRDISPANLFVTEGGRIKLLDFGIAQYSGATSEAARRILTGTVNYMSPEQALGHPVDARSDIFSIGVVLYEMLTGRRAFPGDNLVATLNRIVQATPIPLPRIVANLPSSLEEVVRRCLEKTPERRYQTAEELREVLRSAAASSRLDAKKRVKFFFAASLLETGLGAVNVTRTVPFQGAHSNARVKAHNGSR